jgi:hypothetical protein
LNIFFSHQPVPIHARFSDEFPEAAPWEQTNKAGEQQLEDDSRAVILNPLFNQPQSDAPAKRVDDGMVDADVFFYNPSAAESTKAPEKPRPAEAPKQVSFGTDEASDLVSPKNNPWRKSQSEAPPPKPAVMQKKVDMFCCH